MVLDFYYFGLRERGKKKDEGNNTKERANNGCERGRSFEYYYVLWVVN